jgi:hypothetical protein
VNYEIPQSPNLIKRIGFGPSVMWWWGNSYSSNCSPQIDPDCIQGAHHYRYFPGSTKDVVGEWCADYGQYSIHNLLYAVSSILEVGFSSYTDSAGNVLDYLEASVLPDYGQTVNGEFATIHSSGTQDCAAKLNATLGSRSLKEFFAGFKAY